MKSLLIRLSAFVLDNQHLSAEDKKKLCTVLARSVLSAVCVKTVLRLLMRSSKSTLDEIATSETSDIILSGAFARVPRMVWNRLSANSSYLSSLLKEEKAFEDALMWNLSDFASFIVEFWRHAGLLKSASWVDCATAGSLDEELKNLGLGGC
ncbi:unnamed protein product [Nippostrongylus brasiliensis]|uniref:BTB/POZ domain-containing protein n=1 Tax=Nippostrongylus brasiliensis TaxID=27835 RepID=A0A0N4YYQ5_NIPBR|nr:unnamed protein product [Nippostrongylus brasiliensis]